MADGETSPGTGKTLIILIFHPGKLTPRALPGLRDLVNGVKEDCQWQLGRMGIRATKKILYLKFQGDIPAQATRTDKRAAKQKAYMGIVKVKQGRAYCPRDLTESLNRQIESLPTPPVLFHFGLVSKSKQWELQDLGHLEKISGKMEQYLVYLNSGVKAYLKERQRVRPEMYRVAHQDSGCRSPKPDEIPLFTTSADDQQPADQHFTFVLPPDVHEHGIARIEMQFQIQIHPSRIGQRGNTAVFQNGPPLPDTGGNGVVSLARNETGGAGALQAISSQSLMNVWDQCTTGLQGSNHSWPHLCGREFLSLPHEEALRKVSSHEPADFVLLLKMIDQLRTNSNPNVLQEELKNALNKSNPWPIGKGRYMDTDCYLDQAKKFGYIVYIPCVPRDILKLRPYAGSKVASTSLLEPACGVSHKPGAADVLIFLVLGKLAWWIFKRF